jgi:hypothetical protein
MTHLIEDTHRYDSPPDEEDEDRERESKKLDYYDWLYHKQKEDGEIRR